MLRETHRENEKERERETRRKEKAETERPPTLVSCGWFLVTDLSPPPFSSYNTDTANEFASSFSLRLVNKSWTSLNFLIQRRPLPITTSSRWGEHWTTLSLSITTPDYFHSKDTRKLIKQTREQPTTNPQKIIKVKTRTKYYYICCFILCSSKTKGTTVCRRFDKSLQVNTSYSCAEFGWAFIFHCENASTKRPFIYLQ